MKPLIWVASALEDLRCLPESVQSEFGFALYLAQVGQRHAKAKPLNGFGGAGVQEVRQSASGATFRAIYVVEFPEAAYVLHCFQKKSHSGSRTPVEHVRLIDARLRFVRQISR